MAGGFMKAMDKLGLSRKKSVNAFAARGTSSSTTASLNGDNNRAEGYGYNPSHDGYDYNSTPQSSYPPTLNSIPESDPAYPRPHITTHPGYFPPHSSSRPQQGDHDAQHAREHDATAAEVRRATRLLRRLFEQRIRVWATRNTHARHRAQRDAVKRQAEDLVRDLQAMAAEWAAMRLGPGAAWSVAERGQIEWIREQSDLMVEEIKQGRFWEEETNAAGVGGVRRGFGPYLVAELGDG
ncbi:hypothetical protein BT67DRAFT_455123 [Trichocladium antarcticum]|uniref:Uncharacterized protein n=1 Tax=Trichocladium antarcticum TaxID=1450529 RepID=A0AAN6UMH2_9PEZI|nr:hypothetical protein BT67DRAFT_455123 [Trichocladium antarcticum]